MGELSGYDFFPVEFDVDGDLTPLGEAADLCAKAAAYSDLIVVSHGWNNDKADANRLYERLFANVRQQAAPGRLPAEARVGIVGVFWPSKKFTDPDLIPGGGAASLGGSGVAEAGEALDRLAEALEGDVADRIGEAKALLPQLDRPGERRRYADLVRGLLPRPADRLDDPADRFFGVDGDELVRRIGSPDVAGPGGGSGQGGGGAALPPGGLTASPGGGAAGLMGLGDDLLQAAQRLANYGTYYVMKERAGKVGAGGLNRLLGELRTAAPKARIHLVGHSFGARVVTAAAAGPQAFGPASLTLLQGAFSHNGFGHRFDGTRDGFFRAVIDGGTVTGPIAITHTAADRAVGTLYAIASRIAGQDAAAVGGPGDPYGGIGRNGALHLKEGERNAAVDRLRSAGQRYAFADRQVHNLLADGLIADHGDVHNPAVANLLVEIVAHTAGWPATP